MKPVAKVVGVLAVVFALTVLAAYALVESGEVVVLRTSPEDGNELLARLWVVDYSDRPWISTTDPSKTDWIPWLRSHQAVQFERAGLASCRQATVFDDREVRDQLNRALVTKYRIPSYGSSFLKLVGGARDESKNRIWIRLDPCAAS